MEKEETRLHGNKHDLLLKLKTRQVSGARCLRTVHREFEHLGGVTRGRKCWVRGTSRRRQRRWEASGSGKPEMEGRWGAPSRHEPPPFLQHLRAQQPSCARAPSPSRQHGARTEGPKAPGKSLVLPTSRRSLSLRALSAGIRRHLCHSLGGKSRVSPCFLVCEDAL